MAIALPQPKGAVAETSLSQDHIRSSNPSELDAFVQLAQSADESASAADELTIETFFNISHVEEGGIIGLTGFEAFFPLFQTPGETITFLTSRLYVNNNRNVGGGLQVGYRQQINDDVVWGAHGGLDVLDTGNNTFTQLGVGTELLGDRWDLQLNSNVPIGDRQQSTAPASQQVINPQFVNDQLTVDQGFIQQKEAALTTVSLDGGVQLFDFDNVGILWGRGGLYYLGGAGSEEGLGFRLSLDHRLRNNLRFGLGVQNDPVFDTNVIFSVNALINTAEEAPSAETASPQTRLWSRAAEPLRRTNSILVQTFTDLEISQTNVAATNPETDRKYTFLHVSPDAGTSNGASSIDDPSNTIANAVTNAAANNDNIVYVQAGDAGGAFSAPAGVQLRSVGPRQQLNTQFGIVTLPGSGSGNFPTVSGTATIGSESLLSGFSIDPGQANDGIFASNANNVSIEDNRIANARRGIRLSNLEGDVSITRNEISSTAQEGIRFDPINGSSSPTVSLIGNEISNTGRRGIGFNTIGGDANVRLLTSNNELSNTGRNAIGLNTLEGNATLAAVVNNNTVEVVDGNGINVAAITDNGSLTLEVTGNSVSQTTGRGINVFGTRDSANANVLIQDNNVSAAGNDGINIANVNDDSNAVVIIQNNTLTDVTGDGIMINNVRQNANANIGISGNRVDQVSVAGVGVNRTGPNNSNNGAANLCLHLENNTVTMAGSDGYLLSSTGSGAFQILNLDKVVDNNVGSFNPTDILTNTDFVSATTGSIPFPTGVCQ